MSTPQVEHPLTRQAHRRRGRQPRRSEQTLFRSTDFGDDLRLRLTVSVGVSTFPQHGRNRDAILEASDQAMYLGKARGRDRVCSADDLSSAGDAG